MDCIFNNHIPPSSKTKYIVRPTGTSRCFLPRRQDLRDRPRKLVLRGIRRRKAEKPHFQENIHKDDPAGKRVTSSFGSPRPRAPLLQINDTLMNYWPCPTCFCIGYACCPCTLGERYLLTRPRPLVPTAVGVRVRRAKGGGEENLPDQRARAEAAGHAAQVGHRVLDVVGNATARNACAARTKAGKGAGRRAEGGIRQTRVTCT